MCVESKIDRYNLRNRDLIPRSEVIQRIKDFKEWYSGVSRGEYVALDLLEQEFITR